MNIKTLLADPAAIRLEKIIAKNDSIIFVVVTKTRSAKCPRCDVSSARIHSHYVRHVADLPWQGIAVRLDLHARKFRCMNDLCQQTIYCERLPSIVARYARKTTRLADALTIIGFCLGGRPGARLSAKLAMRAGRDTLLRFIRRAPQEEYPTPSVLGVDDWATRKGYAYGTILVDLERRRPIELLADREASTLAAWLRAHSGVEVISRDRGGTYAEGARQGAPHAVQVADRWHLLKNLGDALKRLITRDHAAIRRAAQCVQCAEQERTNAAVSTALNISVIPAGEVSFISKGCTAKNTCANERRKAQRERRLVLYEKITGLHNCGMSQRAIARRLHLARNTVRHFLRADSYPETLPRGRRPGSSTLERFKPYLLTRWRAGCTIGTLLWYEVREQGFCGSIDVVQRFISSLRAQLPIELRNYVQQHTSGKVPLPQLSTRAMCSPREVVWLLLREPTKLKDDGRTLLEYLFAASADVTTAYAFAQSFRNLMRERKPELLRAWIRRATRCHVREIRSFGEGLIRDYKAVEAALTTPWSQGQVEGQINRLKTIKRQMYGKANLDLLKARVLHIV